MNSSISSSEAGTRPGMRLGMRLGALFAGFLLALAAATGAGEAFLRAKVVPIDQFWQHVDLFYAAPSVNAAFGDSYIARGFLGSPDMVNLAWPGETITQMKIKIEAYYKDRKPGRVILLATPHMFSEFRNNEMQRNYTAIFAEKKRRYRPLGLYTLDGYYRPRLIEYLKSQLTTPGGLTQKTTFLRYGGLMLGDRFDPALTPAENLQLQLARSTYLPANNFRRERYARDYQEMVDFLRSRGAQLCLVTMPVTDTLRNALDNPADMARTGDGFRFFQEVAGSRRIKYLSYWDRLHDPALFMNVSHLNRDGAAAITPIILHDCFGSNDNQAR